MPTPADTATLALTGRHRAGERGPYRFKHGWIPLSGDEQKTLPSDYEAKVRAATTGTLETADKARTGNMHATGGKFTPGHKAIRNELVRRNGAAAPADDLSSPAHMSDADLKDGIVGAQQLLDKHYSPTGFTQTRDKLDLIKRGLKRKKDEVERRKAAAARIATSHPMALSRSQAPLGTKPLWNTEGIGLPGYVRQIARSLMESGKSKSQAIQLAIGIVRRWARGGGNVTEKTRAKAAKAVAEFEAARARAKATPNKTAHELASDALALATVELDNSGSGPTTTQLDAGSRRAHARRGVARPDGSYPIRNATDLANAIAAYGRSKPADRAKVRAHIVKRAKALGLEAKLPDGWRQVAPSHGPFDALALAGRNGGPQRYRHGWIPISSAGDKPRFADGASGAKKPKLDAAQVQDVRDRLAVLEQHAPEIARRQRALLNGLHADGKLTSDRLRIAKGGIDRLIANHRPRTPSNDPDLVAFSQSSSFPLLDPVDLAEGVVLVARGTVRPKHLVLGNGPSCQCGGPHDLVFYANRSTPQVVDAGKPAEPKKGYGKVTRRRRANASEEKQIKSGQWIRVDQSGNTPSDANYTKTKYRPGLVKAAQEDTMSNPCPTCGVGVTPTSDGGLALAMPPQLAKAQKAGKTGAKKAPKLSSTSGSTTVNPDAAKSDVQVPAGQEDAFKKLVAQIMKRPGMDQEKAEKVAAALLRNRKPAKSNA